MIDLAFIHNKRFSIIFVEDDGTEEGRWIVVTGIAKWREGHLFVQRSIDFPEFPIPDDTLDRVKPVAPSIREILDNADFCTMLTVGPLPPDINADELINTGWRL